MVGNETIGDAEYNDAQGTASSGAKVTPDSNASHLKNLLILLNCMPRPTYRKSWPTYHGYSCGLGLTVGKMSSGHRATIANYGKALFKSKPHKSLYRNNLVIYCMLREEIHYKILARTMSNNKLNIAKFWISGFIIIRQWCKTGRTQMLKT